MAEKTEHELTAAEAELLKAVSEDAFAAAGGLGGSIGGALGGRGAGEAGGRKGGASGGRFGARFTKARTAETSIEVSHDPDVARERARAAIAATGEVIEDPNGADDGSVWGIVASGAMNMAPALLRVQAQAIGPGRSRVHVRATGREGLIKQRIGAKAADRIAEAVSQN
jgi:hypothetical protein